MQEKFELVGARMLVLTRDLCEQLLAHGADWGPISLQPEHVAHLTSGPSIAVCVRREHAVAALLRVAGPVSPRPDMSIASIRAALGCRSLVASAVHGARLPGSSAH